MRSHLLPCALLLSVVAVPTWADSLRCGERIVGDEASAGEVLAACGKPAYRDAWRGAGHGGEEEWTYNFGSSQLLKVLRFRDGHVTQIDVDGYGFEDEPAKACTPTDLDEGMSKYRPLKRCGPPLHQESYGALTTVRRADGRIVARGLASVYREKWTYDFGPQYFLQFVTFENGRITDVATGERGTRRPGD